MSAACVIVAGGSGSRLPADREKQFLTIGGRPILEWSLAAAESAAGVDIVVVAVPAGKEAFVRDRIVKQYGHEAVSAVVAGGPTRAESVRLGLAAVPATVEWILVHDAVRPLASPALFERVLQGAGATGAAVPVVPIADTVKRVADGMVAETVDRSRLALAQTPQAFGQRTLVDAHARAEREGADGSDCAVLVERNGGSVATVAGEAWNLKITTPADLRLAEAILATRQREAGRT